MLSLLLSLFLSASSRSLPSLTKTAWMSPEAFHLKVGMPKEAAMATLRKDGWKTLPGKEAGETVIDYGDGRTVTLAFGDDEVKSIRFEFVGFAPVVRSAYEEQRQSLRAVHGKAKEIRSDAAFLMYETTRPQIHVVLSTAKKGSFGKQGLGFLVVRYFNP